MRSPFRLMSLCLLWVPLTASAPRAAQQDIDFTRVDKLFAKYDRKDAPGCVVAVVKDGKVVYKRGFGVANLEHGIPITPQTVFQIGSISKQFTAFLIHLLVSAGLMSLDDDVRQHVPELPDFGKKITVRHLLHHTSGLREETQLMMLAGWRMEDVITRDDFLGLVKRQKELNFDPGSEHLYCNTGYTLLGLIAERVGKKSLPSLAREKLFEPLGMKDTQFRSGYRAIIKNAAASYAAQLPGGYEQALLAYDMAGATALYTTVDDLARWDQNFYDARVGGKDVIAAMLQKGKLNDGKEIAYASGVVHGSYRGLKTVTHGGSHAGYRAMLQRFPEERCTVIVLANRADMNTGLAHKVADVVLEGKLKPAPKEEPKKPPKKSDPVTLSPEQQQAFPGDFYSAELEAIYHVAVKDGKLVMRHRKGEAILRPLGEDKFSAPLAGPVTLHFRRDAGKQVTGFTIDAGRIRNLRFTRAEIKLAK